MILEKAAPISTKKKQTENMIFYLKKTNLNQSTRSGAMRLQTNRYTYNLTHKDFKKRGVLNPSF